MSSDDKNDSFPSTGELLLAFHVLKRGLRSGGCFTFLIIVAAIVIWGSRMNKDYSPYPATEAVSAVEKEQQNTYYVEIIGNVNLRTDIGTDNPVLIVIPIGEKLICTEKRVTSGGYLWYKTSYKNKTGWFYGRYAREIPR